MEKIFEEIFEEVMQELRITEWYILFDSDEFEIVEQRISDKLEYDCWECEEFVNWYKDMSEDL